MLCDTPLVTIDVYCLPLPQLASFPGHMAIIALVSFPGHVVTFFIPKPCTCSYVYLCSSLIPKPHTYSYFCNSLIPKPCNYTFRSHMQNTITHTHTHTPRLVRPLTSGHRWRRNSPKKSESQRKKTCDSWPRRPGTRELESGPLMMVSLSSAL